jgi:hypothetical protein
MFMICGTINIEEGLNLTEGGRLFKRPKALSENRLTLPNQSDALKKGAKAKNRLVKVFFRKG